MKWIKVDENGNEFKPKSGSSSFLMHDYVDTDRIYKILNKSFLYGAEKGFHLTKDGKEIAKFTSLKKAKEFAESL